MAHESDSTDPAQLDTDLLPGSIRYRWEDDGSPALAIVELVAEATGQDPGSVPPLYESIDIDAVEALVDGSARSEGSTCVTFTHAGVEVTVGSDGEIIARTDGANPRTARAQPRTDEEVSAQLKDLLTAAARNGIPVSGGWVVRNGPELPDWDVHITEVTKPDDGQARD